MPADPSPWTFFVFKVTPAPGFKTTSFPVRLLSMNLKEEPVSHPAIAPTISSAVSVVKVIGDTLLPVINPFSRAVAGTGSVVAVYGVSAPCFAKEPITEKDPSTIKLPTIV